MHSLGIVIHFFPKPDVWRTNQYYVDFCYIHVLQWYWEEMIHQDYILSYISCEQTFNFDNFIMQIGPL